MANKVNIRDINPLEHITSDLAKARFNYESILNGLVEWNTSKTSNVTVRLMTDTDPYFVDYNFPTRASYETGGATIADSAISEGGFSYQDRIELAALYNSEKALCDSVGIRINVNDNSGTKWRLCENVMVYDDNFEEDVIDADDTATFLACRDYPKGVYVRRWVLHNGTPIALITKTAVDISKGDEWTVNPLNTDAYGNWIRVIERWNSKHSTFYTNHPDDVFVIYANTIYRPMGDVGTKVPASNNSMWERMGSVFSTSATHGNLYAYYMNSDENEIYDAEFYVYTGDDTTNANSPYEIENGARYYSSGWETTPVVFIPIEATFKNSIAIRLQVTTDIKGFVLQMVEEGMLDGSGLDIKGSATIYAMSGTTEEHKGLKIFESSNYANWPVSNSTVWRYGHNYRTDITIGASGKQEYSAQMVFRHTDPDTKQCNIINYDGPDLDQGLCIYLPVEDSVIKNDIPEYRKPVDGYMLEFLFRIWPDANYNGHETPDLIINKAQIYVYSVPNVDQLQCHGGPIAKFSMARLTNFYVFSENIAVPNRPVLYKAKFIYSAADDEWKTYDYYQVPDHIFLSPKGFVDPSIRSDDSYGVETAGFPLIQDPFSGYDLSPIMVDDEYLNRIQN